MNNEIKEILETIKKCIVEHDSDIESFIIDIIHWKQLLDYITNLQEENKHLDEVNCKLRKGGEILKDTNKLLLQQKGQLQEDLDMLDKRIDKTIEYIDRRDIEWGSKEHNILLNILKGSDNYGKDEF